MSWRSRHQTDGGHDSELGQDVRQERTERAVSIAVSTEQNSPPEHGPSCAQYSRLLSLFYAILLMILGFIFPLSEALSEVWLESAASAIFLAYMTGIGTIYLLYLQFYVLRKASKSHHHQHRPRDPVELIDSVSPSPRYSMQEWEARKKLDAVYAMKSAYDTTTGDSMVYRSVIGEEGEHSIQAGMRVLAPRVHVQDTGGISPARPSRRIYQANSATDSSIKHNRSYLTLSSGIDHQPPSFMAPLGRRCSYDALGRLEAPRDLRKRMYSFDTGMLSDIEAAQAYTSNKLLARLSPETESVNRLTISRRNSSDVGRNTNEFENIERVSSVSILSAITELPVPPSECDTQSKTGSVDNQVTAGPLYFLSLPVSSNNQVTARSSCIQVNPESSDNQDIAGSSYIQVNSESSENQVNSGCSDNQVNLSVADIHATDEAPAIQITNEIPSHTQVTSGSNDIEITNGLLDIRYLAGSSDMQATPRNEIRRSSSNEVTNESSDIQVTGSSDIQVISESSYNQVEPETSATQIETDDKPKLRKSRVISVTPVLNPVNISRERRFAFSGPATNEPNLHHIENIQSDDDDDDDNLATELTLDDRMEWVDVSKFGSIFSHGGSSFYLRIGALIFGLGNVVYCAVELRHVFEARDDCVEKFTHGWSYIPRLVFVIVQTFFLFKCSKVHITKQESVSWLGLMHVMATNMCLWFRTLVSEIKVEFSHSADHGPADGYTNTTMQPLHTSTAQGLLEVGLAVLAAALPEETPTGEHHETSYETCNRLVSFVSRYLFPLVLEYSLTAIGFFISVMHTGIGKDGGDNLAIGFKNLIKVSALSFIISDPVDESGQHLPGSHHESKMFAKSHSGLFLGMLMVAVSLVGIVMFHVYDGDDISFYIFKSSDIFLHAAVFVSCVTSFYLINPLAHVAKPSSVDDILLLISMIGSVTYEISVIVPSMAALTSDRTVDADDILHMVGSLLGALQTVLQTMFILLALRRYPAAKDHITKMPGRGSIAFLLLANVAIWLLRTFLGKAVFTSVASDYYGDVAWLLLLNINYPLLLFFRFHSSVCFADIWHVAYTPIHRKLAQISQPSPAQPQPPIRSSGDGGALIPVVSEVTSYREIPRVHSSGHSNAPMEVPHSHSHV